jgi:hypothetical protein
MALAASMGWGMIPNRTPREDRRVADRVAVGPSRIRTRCRSSRVVWARGEAFPLSSPGQEQHVNEAHDRDEDAVGEPLRSASSKASRESLDDACLDEPYDAEEQQRELLTGYDELCQRPQPVSSRRRNRWRQNGVLHR